MGKQWGAYPTLCTLRKTPAARAPPPPYPPTRTTTDDMEGGSDMVSSGGCVWMGTFENHTVVFL